MSVDQAWGLHHLALKVMDLRGCEHFYTRVLGLTVVDRHYDDSGDLRSVWLKASPGEILLMLERSAGEGFHHGDAEKGWHLAAFTIGVDERASWKKRLKEHGIEVESESPFSLYFRDPEGNRLALSHYPDKEALS